MALKSGTWYVLAMLLVPAILVILFLIFSRAIFYELWVEKKTLYQTESWGGLDQLRTQEQVQTWQAQHLPEAQFFPQAQVKGFDLISQSGESGSAQIQFHYQNLAQKNPEIQFISTSFVGKSSSLLDEQEILIEKKP